MKIEAEFEKKMNMESNIITHQEIKMNEASGEICQDKRKFTVCLDGNKTNIINVLRNIWELTFLYEGYFYVPRRYVTDEKRQDTDELYFLPFYRTGETWIKCAMELVVNNKEISGEKLKQYDTFRNQGREDNKLIKSLMNSFFYVHSESYEKINVNHRLSLLLNMCDGFMINTEGDNENLRAHIKKIMEDTLDEQLIRYGVSLLGINYSHMYNALMLERHEIDHYCKKSGSLSEYVIGRTGRTRDFIYWYFVYILELALRIGILKKVGCEPDHQRVECAINNINDWVILECGLKAQCKTPNNRLIQELNRGYNSIRMNDN